jgi:hypothetical protein
MPPMNAIYIDFECLKTKPSTPILLGMLKDMGGETRFEQVIVDESLESAARASHLSFTTFQGAVERLAADAELNDCPIVGWSCFDRDLILNADVLAALKQTVSSRYENALLTAKPWKTKLYPKVKIAKADKFAPKNTLDKFAEVANYPHVETLRSGTPANRDVQKAVTRAGHYRRIKKASKQKWRALLDYNEHDCRALRHISLKASFELAKWGEYEHTKYCFQPESGSRICFMIGSIDKKRDAVLDRAGASRWAFITAWNPASRQLSDEENSSRQSELATELHADGYQTLSGMGIGEDSAWPPESSLFVLGIPKRNARRLGRKCGQLAIVVGHKSFPAQLVRC